MPPGAFTNTIHDPLLRAGLVSKATLRTRPFRKAPRCRGKPQGSVAEKRATKAIALFACIDSQTSQLDDQYGVRDVLAKLTRAEVMADRSCSDLAELYKAIATTQDVSQRDLIGPRP